MCLHVFPGEQGCQLIWGNDGLALACVIWVREVVQVELDSRTHQMANDSAILIAAQVGNWHGRRSTANSRKLPSVFSVRTPPLLRYQLGNLLACGQGVGGHRVRGFKGWRSGRAGG
jgi:hypothetical protein